MIGKKINLQSSFLSLPSSFFKNEILRDNDFLKTYEKEFERLIALHPIYKYGWKASFLDEHRMINWVVFYMLKAIKEDSNEKVFQNEIILPNNFNVCDLGCYDSCLVSLLNNQNIKTYGYDDHDWEEMFKLLNTTDKINLNHKERIDVAVVNNYAHNFTPKQLFEEVEKKCNGTPSLIFFDFDKQHSHGFQTLYFNEKIIEKLNLNIIDLKGSKRVLFLWINKNVEISKREIRS